MKNIVALLLSLAIAAAAQANDNEAKKNIEPVLQGIFGKNFKVNAVRKIGAMGLYEVQVGNDVIYTDEKAAYVFMGDVIDVKARRNLTKERTQKLAQIKFSDLPLDQAIKQVKGNGGDGKRVLATFEDPNCGYCKKLAKELAGITDVTIYTFLYPILSADSTEKSKNIWCAADRVKAWNDWMVNNIAPAAAKCDTAAIDKSVAHGQKLGIGGTPTIFFADGSRAPGAIPAAEIEKALAANAAK